MNDRSGQGIRAPRVRRRRARVLAAAASASVAVLIATAGANASVAAPADFPSWSDVQAAKRDEASAKAELARLTAQIQTAQVEVDRTQKESEARGAEYAVAQQAYDEQVLVTQKVQEQQAAAQAAADQAKLESTQLIASLARQGGNDVTAGLLGDTGGADSYLYRIGAMQKVSERSDAVYAHALQLQNTAKALAAQEEVEQATLDTLKADAQAKYEVARDAAVAAADQLAALDEAKGKAEALSAYLTDKREVTEADYLEGIRAKWGSGAAGEISPSGWARPSSGHITSNYGNRFNPVRHVWMLHTGVDLAPGCNAPIFAAHAGTVTYAGWYGSWGNYIEIDNGDGTGTGYAHIVNGGIGVSVGQEVGPGQLIAKVGTTGESTGCHLHFIVRVNGNTTDPVPFMRGQGISLG